VISSIGSGRISGSISSSGSINGSITINGSGSGSISISIGGSISGSISGGSSGSIVHCTSFKVGDTQLVPVRFLLGVRLLVGAWLLGGGGGYHTRVGHQAGPGIPISGCAPLSEYSPMSGIP
jgi:hypothetical protein